jgi:hypothetical protein
VPERARQIKLEQRYRREQKELQAQRDAQRRDGGGGGVGAEAARLQLQRAATAMGNRRSDSPVSRPGSSMSVASAPAFTGGGGGGGGGGRPASATTAGTRRAGPDPATWGLRGATTAGGERQQRPLDAMEAAEALSRRRVRPHTARAAPSFSASAGRFEHAVRASSARTPPQKVRCMCQLPVMMDRMCRRKQFQLTWLSTRRCVHVKHGKKWNGIRNSPGSVARLRRDTLLFGQQRDAGVGSVCCGGASKGEPGEC